MIAVDELGAGLSGAVVGKETSHRSRAAPDVVGGLVDGDVGPGSSQAVRAYQPGESGTHNHHSE